MISNCLRELREARMHKDPTPGKWTQQGLANQVGVSRQTIITIEKGTYNPSLELAFKLAQVFEVRIEEIFTYKGDDDET